MNHFRDVRKQTGAGMRVRVHEDQPVAGRSGSPGVARAADLVDGLEDDFRSSAPRQLGSAVGGIVVADDGLHLPAKRSKRRCGGSDPLQRAGNQLLFIKGRDDDGNFHETAFRPFNL